MCRSQEKSIRRPANAKSEGWLVHSTVNEILNQDYCLVLFYYVLFT